MNGKLIKKTAIIGIVLVFACCMLGLVIYQFKPIENTVPEKMQEEKE